MSGNRRQNKHTRQIPHLGMLFFALIIGLLSFRTLRAGQQQFADLGNFPLLNGQIIKNCRLGFRIYGKMDSARSNVILFPTWFGGQSAHIGWVLGKGKLVDTTRYCVIAIDALGNGISSSPSNSLEQPGEKFPEFTIADMVRAQHLFVRKHLGLKHVLAVMGGSMGGMQTFEWMVRYPRFMDKAIPYVGTPQFGPYDILEWRQILNMVELGWRYGMPQDSIRGMVNALTTLLVRTPQWVATHYKVEQMDSLFGTFFKGEPKIFTNANLASQIKAMLKHDVAGSWGGDLRKAARRVKARVLIIQVSSDHMVNPLNALKFARFVHARTFVFDSPCGHLGIGCNMAEVSKEITNFLAE